MSKIQTLLNHQTTISRKYLPFITILLVVCLGTAVYFAFAATSGIIPPNNPSSNVRPPNPNFYSDGSCVAQNGGNVDTPQCNNEALEAINNARSQLEGLGGLMSSSQLTNFASMPIAEQQFVLVNQERTSRGLPAAVGMTNQLNNDAQVGANAFNDPPLSFAGGDLTGGVPITGGGGNYCGDWNTLTCNFEYMYDDGPGGSNTYCQPNNMSGCWGHRDNILTVCPSGSQLYMGAAYSGTVSSTNGSYTEDIICAAGTPTDINLTWSQASNTLNSQSSSSISQSSTEIPSNDGWWEVGSDGGVFSYGNAQFHGSAGSLQLNQPVVGMATTPDGGGYWLVAGDGGIFTYGDAQFEGATPSGHSGSFVAIAGNSDAGYWLLDSTGQIYTYGNAEYYGGSPTVYNGHFVGMAVTSDGNGYWLVDSTGQVFAYGDAGYYGAPSLQSNIVGIAASPSGGYWEVSSTGGVFSYNAQFYGSIYSCGFNVSNVVGISRLSDGGYVVETANASNCWFSANGIFGSEGALNLNAPVVGGSGSGAAIISPISTNTLSLNPQPPGPNQAIYAISNNGFLWQREYLNNNWSSWYPMGSPPGVPLYGGATYGLNTDGQATVYATGNDGNVWDRYWTGSNWSGWSLLGNGGSKLLSGVAAGDTARDVPVIFAAGTDGNIYTDTYIGASDWSGWTSLGHASTVTFSGGVAIGRDPIGQEEIFAVGSDGNLWQNTYSWITSKWLGWTSMGHGGSGFKVGVAEGIDPFGRPNIFATAIGGYVWNDWWTGTNWSGWQNLGTANYVLNNGISVTRNQANFNNLFATGSDGNVYQSFWTGTNWSSFSSLGNGGQSLSSGVASPPSPWPAEAPPIVHIASPGNGSTVSISTSGTVTINAKVYALAPANIPHCISSSGACKDTININFLINGIQVSSQSVAYASPSVASYTWNLKQGTLPGTYTITVQSTDLFNSGQLSIKVKLVN